MRNRRYERRFSSLLRPVTPSLDPRIVDGLAIGSMVGSRRQELESIGTGFERPRDFWRHPNRIARMHLKELIVELDPARALQDYVDLLCVSVAVSKRRSLAGTKPEMRQPGLLGSQGLASDSRFPPVTKAVRHSRVLDVVEADPGVRLGGLRF
jgi:hypothetical protein